MFALDQLGKGLGSAFQTQPRIVEAEHNKNLATYFEAEFVSPLQIFGGLREG